MRATRFALALALALALCAPPLAAAGGSWPLTPARTVRSLDGAWRIAWLGLGVDPAAFNASGVETPDVITVPGAWDLTVLPRAGANLAGAHGSVLYRRAVYVTPGSVGRVRFGACGFHCVVFVDGARVAETGFAYSAPFWVGGIAPSASPWRTVEVLANNEFNASLAPLMEYQEDWFTYAGLFRSVEWHELPPAGALAAADVLVADAAPGLKFTGIQAYQGAMQHIDSYEARKEKLDAAIAMVKDAVEGLKAVGLEPELVSGGGTGSYYFETGSGVYNELQCGSYAFMDADYGRILDKDGHRIDKGEWENALFILTSVMSHAKPDRAICDAGLKAQSVDSGLPFIYGRNDVKYIKCSDEHGVIDDPKGVLKVNDKLRLVPGHCDPTCNVHDWYVGVRNGKVETVWPVSARGKAY